MVSYWAISATERISALEAPQANVEWLNIRRKSLQSAQIDKEQEITPKLLKGMPTKVVLRAWGWCETSFLQVPAHIQKTL